MLRIFVHFDADSPVDWLKKKLCHQLITVVVGFLVGACSMFIAGVSSEVYLEATIVKTV